MGRDGRHIKQLTESDWEQLLHELQDAQTLDAFRELKGKALLDAKFDTSSRDVKDIKCLFNAIQVNQIGATSKSKILHLLSPELFVMWDEKIRKDHYQDTTEGYIEFLKTMRNCAEKIMRETTKSVDEFVDEVYRKLPGEDGEHRKTLA